MSNANLTRRARAVLLFLGLGGASLEPRRLVTRLREHGFHVVIQRIASSGVPDAKSQRDDTRTGFRDWISAGTAAIDRLAATHAEINICGISLGATLALAVAAERPTAVDSLTIISAPLYCDGWSVSRWRHLMPLVYHTPLWRLYHPRERSPYGVKNERVRALCAKELEAWHFLSQSESTITAWRLREADRLTRQVRGSIGRVRTPTLMIHAREDDVASLANVRYVRTHLGTNRFAEIVVENSYHLIIFDDDGDYATTKTIQFINTRTKAAGAAPFSHDLSCRR